jgi:murein DD-endopeptidase MepM/ murein hydrolase activator NlpD
VLPTATAALPSPSASARPSATFTPLPSATRLPPTQTLTPTPEAQVCSPLQGVSFGELPGMVANPFAPPSRPGSDDPHHGVDLAQVGAGNMALAGLPVQAALEGQVAAVVADRFPYGNAVIIETRLERLPGRWWEVLALPTPAPTLAAIPALTCPTLDPLPDWGAEARSLYLLYAHMQSPPAFQPDEAVTCGQALGAIGDSGNALNPHLHVEVRIGPSGVRFGSLAHYDPSATVEEMYNYCAWRVSGLFQLVDPMAVLRLGGGE